MVWRAWLKLNRTLIMALGGARRVVAGLGVAAVLALAGWGGIEGLRAWAPGTYETLADRMNLVYAEYLRPGVHYRFEAVHPNYLKVDAAALIRIEGPADADRLRQAAIRAIWGQAGFPRAATPAKVERDIRLGRDTQSGYLVGLPGLGRVDALTSIGEHGLPAEMYLMRPSGPRKGKLVVYLEGHNGPFWLAGRRPIQAFLARGYDVLGVSMPVYTATVKAHTEAIGDWWVTNHPELALFDRPLAPFFQPLAEALNLVLGENEISEVYMVGFSGGAWTATVYAAIDPRVRKSYQVSGTYPMYLRRWPTDAYTKPREWDHFEGQYAPLVKAVNYLELYLLAGLGAGRRHMQILTKYDACCYGGMGWTTYVDAVRARMKSLAPGRFDFVLDTTHASHKLSRFALGRILDDMDQD